jgi:hypothetical protein
MQEHDNPKRSAAAADDSRLPGRSARRPPIAFLDGRGVTWRVTERDARHDPGCHGERCLVFSNENVVRRVWTYPNAWQSLSDGEFDALNSQPLGLPLPRTGTA